MKQIINIGFVCAVLILPIVKIGLCNDQKTNIVTQRIATDRVDYLEKRLDDFQSCYSDMLNTLNMYLAIFLGMVGLSLVGTWWNNFRVSKDIVRKDLDKTKEAMHRIVLKELKESEEKHQIRFKYLQGQLYESFARSYKHTRQFSIAVMWFARAFEIYYKDTRELIKEKALTNVLGWFSESLDKTDSLEEEFINELINICASINVTDYPVQKKNILAKIDSLSQPKSGPGQK